MTSLVVRVLGGIDAVDAKAWDALGAGADNPFVEHAFLALLEQSGSVGKRTGWLPRHVVVERGGRLVGACPLYLRGDSYGEYIFDWGWAQAAARLGVDYYPKMTAAVPFTPATGPRLLVAPDLADDERSAVRAALIGGLRRAAQDEGASSLHVLFCTDDEAAALAGTRLLRRASLQFHWRNGGYGSFDDFLGALAHDERKQLKRERRRVAESGLTVRARLGAEVPAAEWPQLFALYTSTSGRKWGRPYLTRAFFDAIPRTLGERALVVTAHDGAGDTVAMTLSFEKGRHIFGRYWGTSVDVPGLHFELCYYQLVERAIARGAVLVEAGAQGEHKLKRGFLPVLCHSAHELHDARLARAVARFLDEERAAVDAEQRELLRHAPFREGSAPSFPLIAGVPLARTR